MSFSREDLFPIEGGDETCGICRTPCPTLISNGDLFTARCPRCGTYDVAASAWAMLRHDENRRGWVQLSGWCRDQQIQGLTPVITSETIGQSNEWPIPDLLSRSERLLRWNVEALEWHPNPLDWTVLPPLAQRGASYSANQNEVERLKRLLEDLEYFRVDRTGVITWFVTPKGRLRVEELSRSVQKSPSAFVAMWFSDETAAAWENGIRPGIQEAGYDPVRVDQIEHAGRIDDQIILQINRSRFIVADFTGHRGGVYFEAGYALGKGLDVIWTCHADDIDKLHFDIRQYNCIVWRDPEDLRARLPARIENTVGLGPRAP